MTDAQAVLAQVREALANEALFDPGASTADTYGACKAFGTACTPENVRAILAHVEAQAAENERLTAERDELRDVLLRAGFVPCGIPACNCGSWHHRYGLPERMQEIKDALAEAGHELSNENGNLTLNALNALVSERDELRRQLAKAYTRASEVARTLTISENGHARLVDPSGWIAETIIGLTRPAEE